MSCYSNQHNFLGQLYCKNKQIHSKKWYTSNQGVVGERDLNEGRRKLQTSKL